MHTSRPGIRDKHTKISINTWDAGHLLFFWERTSTASSVSFKSGCSKDLFYPATEAYPISFFFSTITHHVVIILSLSTGMLRTYTPGTGLQWCQTILGEGFLQPSYWNCDNMQQEVQEAKGRESIGKRVPHLPREKTKQNKKTQKWSYEISFLEMGHIHVQSP